MHYCAKWEVETLIIYIFLFCFEFMIRMFYAIKKTFMWELSLNLPLNWFPKPYNMRYLKYFVKCLLQRQLCFFCFCNCSGLKEYIGANPALKFESSTTVIQSKLSEVSVSNAEFEESEVKDEFYDAMSADSSSSDEELDNKVFLIWFSSSWNGTLFVVQLNASHICIEILFWIPDINSHPLYFAGFKIELGLEANLRFAHI